LIIHSIQVPLPHPRSDDRLFRTKLLDNAERLPYCSCLCCPCYDCDFLFFFFFFFFIISNAKKWSNK
jgi:hypothetical protein